MDRRTQITPREVAQGRLFSWGSCVRVLTKRGAPNSNYYSVQPFMNSRANFNIRAAERQIFAGVIWDAASEIDEILMPVRENSESHWAATVIRYVYRERGTKGRRKLAQENQLKQFYHLTKLGKNPYYRRLKAVENYVAMTLSASEPDERVFRF